MQTWNAFLQTISQEVYRYRYRQKFPSDVADVATSSWRHKPQHFVTKIQLSQRSTFKAPCLGG